MNEKQTITFRIGQCVSWFLWSVFGIRKSLALSSLCLTLELTLRRVTNEAMNGHDDGVDCTKTTAKLCRRKATKIIERERQALSQSVLLL